MSTQPTFFAEPASKGAAFSPCRTWRYMLRRQWAENASSVNFIMLNPSTADETEDDPTIRRCLGYARDWGYTALVVTNLFAFRSTDPRGLKTTADPIGPDNDRWIRMMASACTAVVCAWGAHGGSRGAEVRQMLIHAGYRPHYLKLTKDGHPSHPLYLPASLTPQPWQP